jgi:hypothetical protein
LYPVSTGGIIQERWFYTEGMSARRGNRPVKSVFYGIYVLTIVRLL